MEDRIDDQLAPAVEGDIAAPLDMDQGDPPLGKKLLGDLQMLPAAAPAEGEGARVLGDEKEVIGRPDRPVFSRPAPAAGRWAAA